MNKGAKFSDCGKYRYQLWRIWDETKPLVQLIGLNPSTANADTDDPTIRRITSLVAQNGYGGFYINLWVFKTTGKPCSCSSCSPNKYNRSKEKIGFLLLRE